MMRSVNASLDRGEAERSNVIFPEVVSVEALDGGAGGSTRYVMLMQGLAGFSSLEALLYQDAIDAASLERIVARVAQMLGTIHRIEPHTAPELEILASAPDPFTKRIAEKLSAVLRADPSLRPVWHSPGRVLSCPCPAIAPLLREVKQWMAQRPRRPLVLVHGDPHLGNVLARRRNRGHSVRLIDPNTRIGFSDPLYDWGKLLHFAEPVGWARARPDRCSARWRKSPSGWSLDATCSAARGPVEHKRRTLEQVIRQLARDSDSDPEHERALALATASAHLGLAALLRSAEQREQRRFVFAHALRQLARWAAVPG